VRPARPAGHGSSWEALCARRDEVAAWVSVGRQGLTLVEIGELLERSGTAVHYRTLARFAAAECGYALAFSSGLVAWPGTCMGAMPVGLVRGCPGHRPPARARCRLMFRS
jgi:hypothetical protein